MLNSSLLYLLYWKPSASRWFCWLTVRVKEYVFYRNKLKPFSATFIEINSTGDKLKISYKFFSSVVHILYNSCSAIWQKSVCLDVDTDDSDMDEDYIPSSEEKDNEEEYGYAGDPQSASRGYPYKW